MTETKTDWELTGLERFGHLEDKIFRVVEAFKTIKKENESLREDNQKLAEELDSLKENESSAQKNLIHLQKEREALRERVEKALSLLATLETK
jgi:FtsZ-binding cell division protein ZapB